MDFLLHFFPLLSGRVCAVCGKTTDTARMRPVYGMRDGRTRAGKIGRGCALLVLHPPPDRDGTTRGKTKKTKIQNLLDRFIAYRDDILRFASDFNVPFTNNNADQAVRMMKVKQKISGCFRGEQGATDFATIRSYIATMKKQGQNIMDALAAAVSGNPFPVMA